MARRKSPATVLQVHADSVISATPLLRAELRNPKLSVDVPAPSAADVYSLGKILYFIFTREIFDGSEEEYSENEARRLANIYSNQPEFAFIDELIAAAVRRNTTSRVQSAIALADRVDQTIRRIEGGGRVLDLTVPTVCIFCSNGHYRVVHEFIC
jgi:hypothetical protein